MNSLPHEVDGWNAGAPALLVLALPFDGLIAIAAHSVARAERHVADNAAQLRQMVGHLNTCVLVGNRVPPAFSCP